MERDMHVSPQLLQISGLWMRTRWRKANRSTPENVNFKKLVDKLNCKTEVKNIHVETMNQDIPSFILIFHIAGSPKSHRILQPNPYSPRETEDAN